MEHEVSENPISLPDGQHNVNDVNVALKFKSDFTLNMQSKWTTQIKASRSIYTTMKLIKKLVIGKL